MAVYDIRDIRPHALALLSGRVRVCRGFAKHL
jgi:hypothetical protein